MGRSEPCDKVYDTGVTREAEAKKKMRRTEGEKMGSNIAP